MAIDPNGPVVCAVAPSETEAYSLVHYLGEHGIKAFVSGAGSALAVAVLAQRVDMQVVVRQCDLARAIELLDSLDTDDPHSEEE